MSEKLTGEGYDNYMPLYAAIMIIFASFFVCFISLIFLTEIDNSINVGLALIVTVPVVWLIGKFFKVYV